MKKLTAKQRKALQKVGRQATGWWAVTGLYAVLIFWLAKDYYVREEVNWSEAISQAYRREPLLAILLGLLLIGWTYICLVWLRTLKQAGISYKDGLKDLFLTLR